MAVGKVDYSKQVTSNSATGVNGQMQDVSKSIFSDLQNKNEDPDKIAKAKGQAFADLMGSVEIKPSKGVVTAAFGDSLQSCVDEIQKTIGAYTGKVADLQQSLDPNSSDYEQKIQEINQEINRLKDEAKNKLNNIYNSIYAMGESSDLLVQKYGKDNIPITLIEETKSILSSSSNPEESIKKVKELIEKYEKQKSQNANSSSKVSSVSTKKPSLNTIC